MLALAACGGGKSNAAPVANAGSARTVDVGAAVTLSGAASSDTDGTIAGYSWTQTAGASVALANAGTSQAGFTVPQSASGTTLTFSLVVTDNQGSTSPPASVSITVSTNFPPVASAGSAQTVLGGVTVTLNGSASNDPDGSIAGYAWTQTAGTAVTLSNAASAQPTFTAPLPTASTSLSFSLVVTDNRGATSAASAVSITVNPLPPTVSLQGNVRFARVGFLNTSPFGLNYANPVLQPARGIILNVLDATTQAIVATTVTDANGHYVFSVPTNTSVVLQAVARMQRDGTQPLPRWDMRVQNGVPGNTPYTFSGASFSSAVGVQDLDIPLGISSGGTATGQRASGPFAILDTLYRAMQVALGVAPTTNFPVLIVDWGSQTAGTFFSLSGGQHIALMADLTEDTDEFDQHVLAHEFGHYIEENFSRSDSIGGSHAIGEKLDPRVAFGEGFGTAFAAIVMNDPLVRDSYVDNGVSRGGGFSVEVNPPSPSFSVAGPGCWCNEVSVWSILWDLYDSSSDGSDNIALGFAPIWDVLTNAQRTTPSATTIFSFITGLIAARPADTSLINTLVSAQNITAGVGGSAITAFATNEANNPLSAVPGVLPVFTPLMLGAPVVVRSVDDAGRYNKVGNRHFLQFTAPTTRSVTLTLSTSNVATDRDPDFVVYNAGVPISAGVNSSTEHPETETFNVTAGTTYVIDAYDCANGCSVNPTPQGTPGDYDLTVTIN
jgi:hypothetical protein